jgi:hypothetical protein
MTMYTLEQQLEMAQKRFDAALRALRGLAPMVSDADYVTEALKLAGANSEVCRLTRAMQRRTL